MSDSERSLQSALVEVSRAPGATSETPDISLLARRQVDVAASAAAEQALLAAGIDPTDPWAAERGAPGQPPHPSQRRAAAPARPATESRRSGTESRHPPTHTPRIPEFDPDTRDGGYVYLRLADHLAARIEAHDLEPGSQLPAERHLARQYGVSIGTVRRVAAELRDRQLIWTLPAKGTYVRR
ncbi:winged helix-turn-helix domain-containing protein [Phytoactinopolyspora limicola]|uniref:winged helix-turn-helix domain-containing protein n=1 Tax=Phytoactinopolyspora limicola TaxID=2715536 RepID=UPI00140E325D|nr:winged helix-turn-helix domain-containing protein [Phytoactinopolyspora limicola]